MSRNAHGALAAIAVLTALAIPATSHAQFGKLIKKKVAETAINKALPQPVAPADTQAARRTAEEADRKARQDAWAHPTPISAENLGNFVTAIRAEQTERAKAAAAPGSPLGKSAQYSAAKAKCTRELAANDTALKKMEADMQALAAAGKVQAMQAYVLKAQKASNDHVALSNRCNSLVKPELTDADFALIRAEDAHEDSVGAAAGGFTSLEYGRLRERVIAYALMPASWQPSGYAPAEIQAIDARRVEIKKLLGNDFDNSGQRASLN
ncbi:MAG TPA: hypothetical protein VK511_07270 [Gemmatimonadaceae bacterium]|nr:hypothetical protein [Gemmatimonadaceae bacterium]